jgi:hypothetical protein
LEQLANASTVVASAQRAAGRYFYFKTLPSDNNRKLYVPVGGSERLLVDPEKKSTTAAHYSIDYFVPSIAPMGCGSIRSVATSRMRRTAC